MSLVQMGDYPVAFFTEEVVGLNVSEEESDWWVLRIYLRNSEPIKIESEDEALLLHPFHCVASDVCGGGSARVRKMDLRHKK